MLRCSDLRIELEFHKVCVAKENDQDGCYKCTRGDIYAV